MKGILSLRGFRKLRTGAIVATGVFLFATSNVQLVQASEEDGVWEARTVEQVKADIASLAKDSNYIIKWGDTLSVISEATGISMDALAQMNQITNVNLIYAHNELGFTQPISTTTGNQTVLKQTVTVVNRQNKQEEVKAFEVTTKEDTQSGKTETVVTEVKPTTKEGKTAPKTEQAPVVTTKEETSKVNQTLVSSQPAEKTATIGKEKIPKVDQTSTTGKIEEKKTDQAPAVVKPAATKAKETTPSNPVEEKKQPEGTTPKETTEAKVDKKETTSPTDNKENSTSEETPTSPTPAVKSEEKVESSAPTTTGKESTTVEKQTDTKPEEASAAVEKPTETPAATEAKETTPSNPVEEKKQTEGTTSKENTEVKVDKKETTSPTDNKENSTSEETPTSPTPAVKSEEKVESSAPTTTGKESTTVEKQTDTNKEQEPAAEKPAGTSVATEAKETTPSNQTEEKADKHIEQPATNTPSKDSVENNEIAPSANNDSNEVASHEEGKKDATVVPKEVTKENKDALDSHKQNKLHEINESSLTSEQKEQAVTKVKELTIKAEKAIEEATTSEDQAKVVDQYEKDLIAIETPNVETPKPDFTKPVESHNPSGSTTIGEGGAISTLASSTPAASEQATSTASTPTTSSPAVSTSTATNPSVSETSTSNTSSENTGFRNAPAYQPRVVRRARSVDAPKDQVAIYYNFVEMKDIAGFLGNPGESIITVPAGSTSEQIRTIVKAKIDAKKAELAKRGYTFTEDYFVDKPQEDTVRYDYVVNFTKAASATETATSVPTASAPAVSESAAPSVPVTNEPVASTPTATNPSVSETSTSNTSSENTGFRNAPAYQPRVVRRARSVDAPKDQVAIYYNFVEMKDIAGFLGNPGESIITVPAGSTSEQIRTIVKAKIDAKKAELAKRGYTFTEDYFVDKPQEDTIRYDYVVNFTKAASLRLAPVSQPRAARNRRSVVETPVKTRTITLYYQLAGLEIAGSLGTPGKNYVITVPETASATEIQQAIDNATRSEKAELARFFKYVGETNLQTDILDRGFGNFDYVITFTR
ncbi:LysM peptidoglycan-binding domain-containing protein [uncultured Granulicatella sp.]|uniref:LysM peptidoglycan-binding domain-containing protein n=1 Tax=uncultured Granulicatella sp. TaxID=316089 RepID=UPI0028D46ED9|nr:LysM peptidoglycan-binding domain-containing protein [uncultured Granulicatella sp.]